MITEAEGYATDQVNLAQGEAERFNQVLASYRQAKDVTQRRLYLDAMAKVVAGAGKLYVVDESVKGLLPLLNMTGTAPKAKEVKP
jgi:membrane protease subunit HflK